MPENRPMPTLVDGMKRLLAWLEPIATSIPPDNTTFARGTILHLDANSADLFVGSMVGYESISVVIEAAESLNDAGITVEQFDNPNHAVLMATGSITEDGQPDFNIALETNVYSEWATRLADSMGEKPNDEGMWITNATHLRNFLRLHGPVLGRVNP